MTMKLTTGVEDADPHNFSDDVFKSITRVARGAGTALLRILCCFETPAAHVVKEVQSLVRIRKLIQFWYVAAFCSSRASRLYPGMSHNKNCLEHLNAFPYFGACSTCESHRIKVHMIWGLRVDLLPILRKPCRSTIVCGLLM